MSPTRLPLIGLACWMLLACDGSGLRKVGVEGSPQRGASDAWVTLVEFGDFQCPYCVKAAPIVEEVLGAYPSADLRLVYKHFPLPFHSRAVPAALAAVCADEQGQFWGMYRELYAPDASLADADLEAAAGKLALNLESWRACLASGGAREKVEADARLGREVEVSGTPCFFVNGHPLVGAAPVEDFKALIDRELAKAQGSGIERARYYDQAVLGP